MLLKEEGPNNKSNCRAISTVFHYFLSGSFCRLHESSKEHAHTRPSQNRSCWPRSGYRVGAGFLQQVKPLFSKFSEVPLLHQAFLPTLLLAFISSKGSHNLRHVVSFSKRLPKVPQQSQLLQAISPQLGAKVFFFLKKGGQQRWRQQEGGIQLEPCPLHAQTTLHISNRATAFPKQRSQNLTWIFAIQSLSFVMYIH